MICLMNSFVWVMRFRFSFSTSLMASILFYLSLILEASSWNRRFELIIGNCGIFCFMYASRSSSCCTCRSNRWVALVEPGNLDSSSVLFALFKSVSSSCHSSFHQRIYLRYASFFFFLSVGLLLWYADFRVWRMSVAWWMRWVMRVLSARVSYLLRVDWDIYFVVYLAVWSSWLVKGLLDAWWEL